MKGLGSVMANISYDPINIGLNYAVEKYLRNH